MQRKSPIIELNLADRGHPSMKDLQRVFHPPQRVQAFQRLRIGFA